MYKLSCMNATSATGTGAKLPADCKADDRLPEHNRESAPVSHYTIQEIQMRAETVTPLLKEILDFHPASHWGIEE